jgi:outer membrane protein assembly factor BamD (BamD/ComL family)
LALHYRQSDRADDALKLVGDYYMSEGVAEYREASLTFLRLAETWPESEWTERCLWLAGHCRMLAAAGPHYDRNELLLARDLLQRSLDTHPRGVAARDAQADLGVVEEDLALSELYVADFYAARGVPAGERLRLMNAAILFPATQAGRLARARLEAQGVDPEAVAADVRGHSIDRVRATRPHWEQERDRGMGFSPLGFLP